MLDMPLYGEFLVRAGRFQFPRDEPRSAYLASMWTSPLASVYLIVGIWMESTTL